MDRKETTIDEHRWVPYGETLAFANIYICSGTAALSSLRSNNWNFFANLSYRESQWRNVSDWR
jgi:hypothetical protein